MALIKLGNLSKTYQMGEITIKALDNVSLHIDTGEFIAITGHSGSGKSTLMHVMGCLDSPTSGSYLFEGNDISHLSAQALAHIRNEKLGFVFQRFYLLPDFTALDNVALPMLYAYKNETAAREAAARVLELVGLGDRMHHFPYQLSGGQQQRVAIARSLINEPAIIFADEPTGNLDSATGKAIMNLFIELNEKKKKTIILVTHDHELAVQAKRIVELVDGALVKDEKVR